MTGHVDTATIGTIYLTNIINESDHPALQLKYITPCKIKVYSDEGLQIPHFHIIGVSNKFECCIRIYDNHFFSHGFNNHRDTLNHQQCIKLNKWLSKNDPKAIVPMTHWQEIELFWKIGNPECKFPEELKVRKQPDYSKMSTFKDTVYTNIGRLF